VSISSTFYEQIPKMLVKLIPDCSTQQVSKFWFPSWSKTSLSGTGTAAWTRTHPLTFRHHRHQLTQRQKHFRQVYVRQLRTNHQQPPPTYHTTAAATTICDSPYHRVVLTTTTATTAATTITAATNTVVFHDISRSTTTLRTTLCSHFIRFRRRTWVQRVTSL